MRENVKRILILTHTSVRICGVAKQGSDDTRVEIYTMGKLLWNVMTSSVEQMLCVQLSSFQPHILFFTLKINKAMERSYVYKIVF